MRNTKNNYKQSFCDSATKYQYLRMVCGKVMYLFLAVLVAIVLGAPAPVPEADPSE
jgi:hypothetical protein